MPKTKVKFKPRSRIKRKAPPAMPVLETLPDFGTPERWQHGRRRMMVTDAATNTVAARALVECALDTLYQQRIITADQRAAGLRLRRTWIMARIEPPRVAKYDARPRQDHKLLPVFVRTAREEEAYAEWRAAMATVPLHGADAVVNVCCLSVLPTAQQKAPLLAGLDALLWFYKSL